MTRAGFILAATLLITPTAAQEPPLPAKDVLPTENIAQTSRVSGLLGGLIEATQSSSRWATAQQIPSATGELPQGFPAATNDSWFSSAVDQNSAGLCGDCQHLVCGDHVGPQINRFDRPSSCTTTCYSEDFCRQCFMGNTGQCHQTADPDCWICDGCGCDVRGLPGFGPSRAFRIGAWGVDLEGSPVKVGEYQDLNSSAFWDLDGILSNGLTTLDYTLSGLDNETNAARAYYYGGPGLAFDFDYQRFLHRLDHDPLSGFDVNSGPPGPTDRVVAEDLNVGEDYAIRVQQLDAHFQGRLTNNLKWKVNLWGMRKSGERQANAVAHCFNVTPGAGFDLTCHVLSQRQTIDWTTMEVEPVLEANIGKAVVEYSRTMRAFGQNDQVVDRTYTAFSFSPAFGVQGPPFNYSWVPENFTQVDQLKLNVPFNDKNQVYANLYLGDTENKFRDTHRDFNGYDVRLINRPMDGVTLTGYAKGDRQTNELPTTFLNTPPFGINSGNPSRYEPGSLRHPIDYDSVRFGLNSKWRSRNRKWLSIAAGYEFVELERSFAEYDTRSGPFTQEDTRTHKINIGPQMRVSPTLDTFVRYKGRFIRNPLIGVRESDGKFNTNQPEQIHRVELGGTWTPSPYFMATAQFGLENSWNYSEFADYDEDNYPINFTLWYAPTARWSLSGGYAFFSNWIDQDITIGFRDNPTETTRWNYEGYNHFLSINSSYAWTPCTQLVGTVEWGRGSNVFSVPPSTAGADWSALPTFSDVIVETTRVNVGIDHEFRPDLNGYFRYVHFDYDDLSGGQDSGTADMVLAGITVLR